MSRITLIGITGKANSGKNTVAEMIEQASGRSCLDSFAMPIYRAVSGIFGIPIAQLARRDTKEELIPGFNFTYRRAMQTLGTEWGRDMLDNTLWLKLMHQRYESWALANAEEEVPDRFFIITDVRFQNEAKWVKAAKDGSGLLLEVVRPGVAAIQSHSSESGCGLEPDVVINNNGDLELLREKVIAFLAGLARE
jgi:hypothetical protein